MEVLTRQPAPFEGLVSKARRKLFDLVTPTPFDVVCRLDQGYDAVRTVFDVGACQGRKTRTLRQRFPNATVYAYEPDPSNFAQLRAATQDDDHVVAVPKAMAQAVETGRTLHRRAHPYTHSLLPGGDHMAALHPGLDVQPAPPVPVDTTTLAAEMAHFELVGIDLLKVDTQGTDLAVLAGAGALLTPRTVRYVVTEVIFALLYEAQCNFGEVVAYMYTQGYRLYGLYELDWDYAVGLKWGDALFVASKEA